MNDPTRALAAQTLRRWALDEQLKARVMSSPELAAIATTVARRYTAGETIADALASARRSQASGHLASIEYTGESVRDAALADAEAQVFVDLVAAMRADGVVATVSGDLSHVGLLQSPEQALANASRIAAALEPLGTAFMISAEGSDRTDAVLDVYEALAARHANVGITLQARLHRSPADLDRLLALPGRIRLVKGAFLEDESVALRRDDPALADRYAELARRIGEAGHPVAVATHDEALLRRVLDDPSLPADTEVEMLLGLGTDLLARLRAEGRTTREYSIFGREWWLYVLNRVAEHPERVVAAVADLGASAG